MNRNRILHPKTGWQYVTAPLANSSISIKTSEARVLNLADTKRSIIGKLSHYKKTAPYFHKVNKLVQQSFDNSLNDTLVSLNVSAMNEVCNYLGITFSYQICSELDLDYPENIGPGGWAPYICEALCATEYVNPFSGKEIFDLSDFQERNISLYFAEFSEFKYDTSVYNYEPNLSILDVMMWNSPEVILGGLKLETKLVKAT